ncbi:MAG: hypothetical protein CL666_09780 [Balneola sp.]|nr:hypothetical protein [Balneola sp.]|tara:strand:+ start:54240 stop:54698 length:459 start_codon:yes stop_codon:yes gene_type:complete
MQFLTTENISELISGIIHEDTQLHTDHIDLTVAEIHRITGAGSLDFGGSEFKPATTEKLEPKQRKPEDDYGWWKLGRGPYKIIFNETLELDENAKAIISPHAHAREAGLVTNTNVISSGANEEELAINVTVSEAGCNIKENARVAAMYILSF